MTNMPKTIFMFVYMVVAGYVLLSKRRFGLFGLGIIASCIYFIPGLDGTVLYPAESLHVRYSLVPGSYIVMSAVLTGLGVFAVLADRLTSPARAQYSVSGAQFLHVILLFMSMVGLAGTIVTSGSSLLSPNKTYMLQHLSRWHSLWAYSAVLAYVVSVDRNDTVVGALSFVLLLGDLYIGFRSPIAIAVMSQGLLLLNKDGRCRLAADKWRFMLIGALFGIFMFVYKQLYISVKMGMLGKLLSQVSFVNLISKSILFSEPYTTQMVLDAVIRYHYHVPASHFMLAAYSALPIGFKDIGAQNSFSLMFQSTLFPGARYGMGGNVWAEMVSTGGAILLILFIVVFSSVIWALDRAIQRVDSSVRGVLVVVSVYMAFYIHRNELAYQVTIIKRLIILATVSLAVSYIVYKMRRRRA